LEPCYLLVMNEVVFLSAQPDDYFFTWQLELQLLNFQKLGVNPENIHILVGYDQQRGLRHYFEELIGRWGHLASFYPYPDTRRRSFYLASLRANIIHQHFISYPWLASRPIFYHDSDIIFRELPDLEALLRDDYWYVSDTRSYIGSDYVIKSSGEDTFLSMCEIVGVPSELVIANDENCGGAQYLLKNVDVSFWKKVEEDSEAIYQLLVKDNLRRGDIFLKTGRKFSEYEGIQAWCADMWAVFYNALFFNKQIRISKDMEFCWATDNISRWDDKKILHYTGVINEDDERFFNKSAFYHYPPYFDPKLKSVSPQLTDFRVVELIGEFNKEQENRITDLTDVSFCFPVRIDDYTGLDCLLANVRYLAKYFRTTILIVESGLEPMVPASHLPSCCSYQFLFSVDPIFHPGRINDLLIKATDTSIATLCDAKTIIPASQIMAAVGLLRSRQADIALPYDGSIVSVDILFRSMFEKILDPDLFLLNLNKFSIHTEELRWDWVFMGKQSLKNMDWIEGWEHCRKSIKCVEGSLFRLS